MKTTNKNMTNFKTYLLLLSLFIVHCTFSQSTLTEGDNYYLISMDDVNAHKIESSIVADFRPNESTNNLYIWVDSYIQGNSIGTNSLDETNVSWVSLIVSNIGWSGAGFHSSNTSLLDKLANVTNNPDNYFLHIALKSSDNACHLFGMDGESQTKFTIGSAPFKDNGVDIPPITDFPRDGKWHAIEIPMTTLKQMGLSYSANNMNSKNILWFLSGGVSGVTLEMDAIYIYEKKLNTAIDNASLSANFIITNKTISFPYTSEPLEFYNIMGVKIKSSHEPTMGIDDLKKGTYIVRSGKNTIKITI